MTPPRDHDTDLDSPEESIRQQIRAPVEHAVEIATPAFNDQRATSADDSDALQAHAHMAAAAALNAYNADDQPSQGTTVAIEPLKCAIDTGTDETALANGEPVGTASTHREHTVLVILAVSTPQPVVLGVEPLTDTRQNNGSTQRPVADAVRSLLDQATHHVDIDTVLADRGLNSADVLAEFDRQDISYIIPARDRPDIRELTDARDHDAASAVIPEVPYAVAGEPYRTTVILVEDEPDLDDEVVFLTNDPPDPQDATQVASRYQLRAELVEPIQLFHARLAARALPCGLDCRACLVAAAEVNAHSLATHLLTQCHPTVDDRQSLPAPQFLQALWQTDWPPTSQPAASESTTD
jgi:hypothetical protein